MRERLWGDLGRLWVVVDGRPGRWLKQTWSITVDSRFLVAESTSDLRSCCSYVESLSRVVDGRRATGVAPRDFINSWDERMNFKKCEDLWGPVRTLWGPVKVYWLYCFVDAIRFRSIQHSARSASVGPFSSKMAFSCTSYATSWGWHWTISTIPNTTSELHSSG